MKAEGSGEVVTTAFGHNQYGRSELYQLAEVAVNSSIAAEKQDDIDGICRCWHADAPVDGVVGSLVILKWLEVFRRTSQPENGCGPHVRG